jgi:serine/threonine protein kinase
VSGEQSGTRHDDAAADALDIDRLEVLRAGGRVHRFVLLERIAAGGMGELHTAFDARLDRKIALKLVRLGRRNEKADGRLLREAQALAKLSHPNVVTVYEVGTDADRLYVAMEYVQGQNLAQWLREAAKLDEGTRVRQLLAHFREAGRGLAAVHAAGFAHRDFKPENVQVGSDGRVRLIDFGLARSLLDAAESQVEMQVGAALASEVDTTDALLGTPRFMAPEQWQRRRGDARSDQFAFSVALYHALHGVWPFEGATPAELRSAVTEGVARQPPRKREVPARLRSVLMRNLAGEPEQRSPDMRELLDAIDAALSPARRRALASGAALVLGTLAALAIVSHEPARPVSPELAPQVERISRELAAERRHVQNVEQLATLADATARDAEFMRFAAQPEHAHTEALSLAWREQAMRLRERGDAARELAALGEAHWASPTHESRRRVLIELAGALDRDHRHVQLGALFDELGDRSDAALVVARAREAASRHDFAAARTWLARADQPELLAELEPLLGELGRATPSRIVVAGSEASLTRVTPLPGIDLDRDGADDLLLAPPEGPLEVIAATPELARLATLTLTSELGEVRSFRHIVRTPGRADSLPYVVAVGPGRDQLLRVEQLGARVEAERVRDSHAVDWALGDVFDADGWQGEEAIGLDFGQRRLIGLREGVEFEPSPSIAPLDSHPRAAVVDDLDGDGRVELVVGVGGWWAYDVRVLMPREPGRFELGARLKLGSMTSMTSYRSSAGRRLALTIARDSPSPRVFPRGSASGAAPGLYLLDWRGPGHELEQLDMLALPDALELRPADLDGDGLDELIVQRNPRGLVIVAQAAALAPATIWLDALQLEAVHDLDDDGDDELIVSEHEGGRVWVLGSGEAALPVLPRSSAATLAPPPGLPTPLVEPWQRADTLARIGLHEQARAGFEELARLVDADDAAEARRRAAELALRSGQRHVAAALFEAADDDASLARAAELYAEVHDLEAAARVAARLRGRGVPGWPARADRLARLAAPSAAIHVDFREPLDSRWSVARAGLVRRDAEGLHIESIGARDSLLLARPFAWTDDRLTLDVALEVSRLEWGAMLIFELVALEGGSEVLLGRMRVGSTGGGGHYVLDLADDHSPQPGSTLDERVMPSPLPDDGPLRLDLHFDVLRDDPRAWARVSETQAGRPSAALTYTSRVPAAGLQAREFELRIRSGDHVWQRGVARLLELELGGASELATPPARSERDAILLALANGEDEQALARLDAAALDLREAAWLRTLALEQLGRFTAATPFIATALGRCESEAEIERFGHALRIEPDRFGPLLREFCPPERFVLTSWMVAWDVLFHHPALVDVHRTMTTQLAELDRFEPRDAAQARAAADLLTARARGWFMQGLESASESDLRRAIAIGERALAGEIADADQRFALQRLVSLAHVRLAGILITRKHMDEVAPELRRALALDAAPEIIADVAFARDFLAAVRDEPIWAELLAAQRGHYVATTLE